MDDERALLAAILAAPDDDTPRLVYADYLDDHDRPTRAEFIRLQVELARGVKPDPACPFCAGKGAVPGTAGDKANPPCGHCGPAPLVLRERDILRDCYADWFPGSYSAAWMPDQWAGPRAMLLLAVDSGTRADLHSGSHGRGGMLFGNDTIAYPAVIARGFVAGLNIPAAVYRRRAAALFAVHPVTEARLVDVAPRAVRDRFGEGWTWPRRELPRGVSRHFPDELMIDAALKAGYHRWLYEDDARVALSAALVARGRELARAGEAAHAGDR